MLNGIYYQKINRQARNVNENIETLLAPDLIPFVLTIIFSFLIGLEVKAYNHLHSQVQKNNFIGTARTFTFIGMIGFLFYEIDPAHLKIFSLGYIGLTFFYGLFYYHNLAKNRYSILPYLILLIVYSLGAISKLYPVWMLALVFVLTIFILNAKSSIKKINDKVNVYEFETLSKMILLSAVILPLLPKEHIIPYIPLSPFKIWLAVVVISAISYGGYVLQKYFFPSRGFFLTGLIGGTYSSTATTIVLSRKLKEIGKNPVITSAIIIATSVMYIRLIVIAYVFNRTIGEKIIIPFVVLSIVGVIISLLFLKQKRQADNYSDFVDSNPLELGTAFVFTFLFVAMIILTQLITQHYGQTGLQVFSFIAGFTDVDPFILSVLTGKYKISQDNLISAIMISAGSNNLMKAAYTLYFGGLKNSLYAALALTALGGITITWALI